MDIDSKLETKNLMDYDFQTLSPDDFEKLITDLFSAEWSTILESYKPGKDSGIDMLHTRIVAGEPRAIIQCKRYPADGFSQLLRSFKNEKNKVDKLKPARYLVATSVLLSNKNKQRLIETLRPWVKSTADIYGQSEINTLLRKHPGVVRAHFKLWISSTASLEAILHSRLFNLTHYTLDEMKTEMCKIVLHDGYDRALAALKDKHHCIIAGNPGIGKTTLAKILLCHYAQEGFEPLVVNNDIDDAWALISKGQDKKMAILYDDFLGQTRYDQLKFGKNEDSLLIQLIKFTERSHNIRFILTSREYIIADARISHGVFDSYVDLIKKCTINLSDYSLTHRAKVLFNHLYFSNLPRDKVKAIVDNKLYVKIIQHRHFNPRIVSAIANKANSESLSPAAFLEYIDTRFDNPAEIWARPFQNEIMPLSRWVLAALWTLGGAARLEVLKEAVLALSSLAYEAELAIDFRKSLREIAENFISSDVYPHSKDKSNIITIISFQNPSISDYIESFLRSEVAWIETLASRTVFFEQQLQLLSLLESSALAKAANVAEALLARQNDGFDKPKGAIYRSFDGPLVFTDSDIFSANERGLAFLKLASFLSPEHLDHKRAKKIITTEEGWSRQFSNLAKTGSVPYATIRVIRWVVGSIYWNDYEQVIKQSFYGALFACINSQPDWCEELSTLNVLHECLSILGVSLTTLEKLKFQTDANDAAKQILKSEDDIQRLEEAADHLEKFQERMRFGNRRLVLELRTKAESQSPSQQEGVSETDEVALPLDEENLNLDSLFSELLY